MRGERVQGPGQRWFIGPARRREAGRWSRGQPTNEGADGLEEERKESGGFLSEEPKVGLLVPEGASCCREKESANSQRSYEGSCF